MHLVRHRKRLVLRWLVTSIPCQLVGWGYDRHRWNIKKGKEIFFLIRHHKSIDVLRLYSIYFLTGYLTVECVALRFSFSDVLLLRLCPLACKSFAAGQWQLLPHNLPHTHRHTHTHRQRTAMLAFCLAPRNLHSFIQLVANFLFKA